MVEMNTTDREQMRRISADASTVSDKIRSLAAAGYKRADIARFLGKRYQHVRNVLVADEARTSARSRPTDENPSTDQLGEPDTSAASAGGRVWARIGPGGRIVIPAGYRDALGLNEGDSVQIELKDDLIRIVPRDVVIHRVQDLVGRYVPDDMSLVDELIDERRRESAREGERG